MTYLEALQISGKNCSISLLSSSFWVSFVLIFGSALLRGQGFFAMDVILMPVVALLIGTLPVLLFAVPLYALFLYRGIASYLSAALLGALPALMLLPFLEGALSLLFAIYGLPIALFAHFLCRRAGRSNNSFKGMPLRGTP